MMLVLLKVRLLLTDLPRLGAFNSIESLLPLSDFKVAASVWTPDVVALKCLISPREWRGWGQFLALVLRRL